MVGVKETKNVVPWREALDAGMTEALDAGGTGPRAEFDLRDRHWLSSIRSSAARRFEEIGLPSTRQEEWKYTSVARMAEIDFRLPGERAATTLDDLKAFALGDSESTRLVFVDGRFDAQLSRAYDLPRGVTITSL